MRTDSRHNKALGLFYEPHFALGAIWALGPSGANFHFRGPRLFYIGILLEGSQRLMSYKLSLHVLVTFTEQVVPIHKHITLFWIPSISATKAVTLKLTKKAAVRLSDHIPITYLLSASLASCNLRNGFRRFVPRIIRNNNQFSTP